MLFAVGIGTPVPPAPRVDTTTDAKQGVTTLLINLLLGLATMTLCLLLQSILLIVGFRYYEANDRRVSGHSLVSKLIVLNGIMLILVASNLIQVAIWGLLFLLLGEFSEFEQAFYHSAVNFATLGYGDIVMSEEYRLLGPLQAVNGILMIGFSTAVLMGTVTDIFKKSVRPPTASKAVGFRSEV